jgi:hypothetical protein
MSAARIIPFRPRPVPPAPVPPTPVDDLVAAGEAWWRVYRWMWGLEP